MFTARSRMSEQRLPEVTPNWREFLKPDNKTSVIWFGHCSLLLNMDGITLLIDPVFSASAAPFPSRIKRFQLPVIPMEALPAIDVIVLSHNHYGHLDRVTIYFFRNKKTHFVTQLGMGKTLQKLGIAAERITERDWYLDARGRH
ncbi:MAG: MBL fold metallo-hydrolase [Symbiopectobacterium sp.]